MSNTTHRLASGISLLLIGLILSTAVTLAAPRIARADAGVLYAAPAAQGSGDCSSWANACTLQTALSSSVGGAEIWVKAGAHYPGAASDRSATFTLKNGVALYGGFTGTETSRDQRDWQVNLTILSGDIDQNDANTDGNYIAEMSADIQGDNAYHVLTGGGTDNTAVLDGLMVTAGQANNSLFPGYYGGGIYNYSSSPSLTNVTFSGNTANDGGGGMYNSYSSPALTNVTFSGNSANYGAGMYNANSINPSLTKVIFSGNTANNGGGGMYNIYSSPTLTNVTFSGNTANNGGGGMFNYDSSPSLTKVTFSGNTAISWGGGIRNYSSSPTLTEVTFSGNTAVEGGGMYNYSSSSPTLKDVTFSGNTATGWGGGMCNGSNSNPKLTNVTFSGNTANVGGGMYNGSSSPTLTNVTFSGNTANIGGGMFISDSSLTLTNVILWGDSAPTGSEIFNNSSTTTIAYSDIQGCGGSGSGWITGCGTDGGGNIDTDPLFVDASASNLRLQLISPAIDAGNNAAVPASVTTDLDGKPRFVDIPTVTDTGSGTPPIVDMGAYEAEFNLIILPLILSGTS